MIMENPLPKGSYAVVHLQKSGYSLLSGCYSWQTFHVVRVTKATRDGQVKEYDTRQGQTAHERVDSRATVYGFPVAFASVAERAFKAQALGFTGYRNKEELKAALEALAKEI